MRRQDAVDLLKQVVAECGSFCGNKEITVARNPETEGYLLRANWSPTAEDMQTLNRLAHKYGSEVLQKGELVVIRKTTDE